jgi:hypothetical protein
MCFIEMKFDTLDLDRDAVASTNQATAGLSFSKATHTLAHGLQSCILTTGRYRHQISLNQGPSLAATLQLAVAAVQWVVRH